MALPNDASDPFDAPYACAAKLHEAGVKFCIRSGGMANTRNLPYEAAMAVSYGLPSEEGLKAVTLYPAQILGVADQLGSIETGKVAGGQRPQRHAEIVECKVHSLRACAFFH